MSKQFYVQVDGQSVEVTEEVYRAYKRPVWTERKRREVRAAHELSLDAFQEAGFDIPDGRDATDNLALAEALAMLADDEREIIHALFFESMSEREVARKFGVSQPAIHKRCAKILKKLKFFLS